MSFLLWVKWKFNKLVVAEEKSSKFGMFKFGQSKFGE